MYKNKNIGLVVPVYNEEKFITAVISRVPEYVDRIYVIDDGSSDNTSSVVEALFDSKVQLLQHKTNKGPGAAITTGYQAALKDKMDVVVKLDGDGQMISENIISLISPIIEKRVDYTKGDRLSNSNNRRGMPKIRLFGNIILTLLTRIASGYWHVSDTQNGFTAISKQALESINIETIYPHFGYLNDILVRLNVSGFEVLDVPMPAKYGEEKSSIRLLSFVPKVSFFLFNRLLWRLKHRILNASGRGLE